MSVPVDQINDRTAARARIKRASARARANLRRIDAESQKQLIDVYQAAANDIEQQIINSGDGGGIVRRQALQSLLNRVNQRIDAMVESRDQLLGESLRSAANNGASPFDGVGLTSSLIEIADEAVRFVVHQVAEDGLQLSERLWRNQQQTRELVARSIQNAVIQGQSASEAARNFISRGENVPADILRREGMANGQKIAKITGAELMTGKGSPVENAKRLFRTEINRAHGESYRASAEEHPDAIGTKFLLSPSHPEVDICDMHAKVNRYGLGAGVYPFGKSPWPAHPNTLSFEVIVFNDEVTEQDRAGKQDRIAWLKEQTPGVQESVLSSRKKRAALEADILTERQISTPWRVLKQRYQRQGIDTDNLQVVPGGIPTGSTPVSAALVPTAYKSVSRDVLAAIDSVHGDGVLPSIPINRSSSKQFEAAYYTVPDSRRAVKIVVTSHTNSREFSLAHEIGHFIDNQAFKGEIKEQWASASHPDFEEWRTAVANSGAVKNLISLLDGPNVIEVEGGRRHRVQKKHIANYLLTPYEMWARSYSQYIAIKSGNTAMLDQMKRRVAREQTAAVSYTSQWTDEDFEPIANAIENLMRKRGWLK